MAHDNDTESLRIARATKLGMATEDDYKKAMKQMEASVDGG